MGARIALPPEAELEEGSPRLVLHDGVPYCVVKTNGRVNAFVATCSHKDLALVPLRMKKGKLVCPHHGATFSPETGDLVDDRGKDVPTGLPRAELSTDEGGTLCLHARKRHRKLLAKKERKRMKKQAAKAKDESSTAAKETASPSSTVTAPPSSGTSHMNGHKANGLIVGRVR